MKIKSLLFLSLILSLPLFVSHLEKVSAQTMSNTQYIIKMGNLNTAAGLGTNSQYKMNETVGQGSSGLYTGTNYTVKAGFQYVKPTKITFSFTISQNLIDFGTLTPTNPIARTTDLTVSSPSGFTVIASENRPLTSSSSTIPDTSCDNGDCTSVKSASWVGTLTYGFGYRCDDLSGTNCQSDFSGTNTGFLYRPFSISPTNQTIMSSTKSGNNKSRITYKVNISSSQPTGTYTNAVTYVASPGF